MTTFRSFDTVLSYNNSALAIYWPKVSLEPQEEYSEVFYISMASGDEIPGGAAYITGQTSEDSGEEAPAVEEKASGTEEKQEPAVENIQAVKEEAAKTEPAKVEPSKTEPAKTETAKPENKAEQAETKTQSISAVDEKTPGKRPSITEDKLTFDYIQMLLDKIENLEEGDPEVNKEEINALNAELDAILEILNAR